MTAKTEKMERVRQMNEKMNVLDVQLDNCTAKDAMKIIAEYMQTEELNTVDIVTVDASPYTHCPIKKSSSNIFCTFSFDSIAPRFPTLAATP